MESAVECSLQVTDKYKGWLNCSYDEQLEGLQLPWLPWIGTGFREQKVRTVILGKSVYDYSKGDAAKRKSIQQQDGLRTRHLKHAIYAKFKSRYVRNLSAPTMARRSRVPRKDRTSGVVWPITTWCSECFTRRRLDQATRITEADGSDSLILLDAWMYNRLSFTAWNDARLMHFVRVRARWLQETTR